MKIGFIGLEGSGSAVCAALIHRNQDPVYVYDANPERIAPMERAGGVPCGSPAEAAQQADLIFSLLPGTGEAEKTWQSMLPELKHGKIGVDLSTIDPIRSVAISDQVKHAGAEFLDCPMVPSHQTFGIYVGGNKRAAQKILPYLLMLTDEVMYIGFNGAGLIMKLCHDALLTQVQNSVNEAMALADASGIGPQKFAMAMDFGNARSRYLDAVWRKIDEGDYRAEESSVSEMSDEVDRILSYAKYVGRIMPGELLVRNVYDQAEKRGLGEEDSAATYKVVQSPKS